MLGELDAQTSYCWDSQQDIPQCTGMNDKDGTFHWSSQNHYDLGSVPASYTDRACSKSDGVLMLNMERPS